MMYEFLPVMYLLPYTLQKVSHEKAEFSMWIVWVFLTNGGTEVWKTDEEESNQTTVESEYFEANGVHGQTTLFDTDQGICLFEIDTTRTHFADFYMWTDFLQKNQTVPPGCDIWRPFFWVGSHELGVKDEWNWQSETSDLSLGSFGTATDLWQVLRNRTILS
jgi:hypothetical protein